MVAPMPDRYTLSGAQAGNSTAPWHPRLETGMLVREGYGLTFDTVRAVFIS